MTAGHSWHHVGMTVQRLAVSIVSGLGLSFCVCAFLAVYFYRKNPSERAKAVGKFNEMTDKAVESRDDPNEPARFVP
jgi:hypothetical protein